MIFEKIVKKQNKLLLSEVNNTLYMHHLVLLVTSCYGESYNELFCFWTGDHLFHVNMFDIQLLIISIVTRIFCDISLI